MGVKYGYEKDKNGRPVEFIVDYFDDGLEVIIDMNELTDYEQIESETNSTPPIYKVPVADLSDDEKDENNDYADQNDEDMNLWKAALFLTLAEDEDPKSYL